MRNFGLGFMSEAAALLIKAQGELSRIVDTLPEFYPRPVVPAAQSASFALSSDASSFSGELKADGTIHLSATHGELLYDATFPTRVENIADFKANVTLGKGEEKQELTLNGAQFFSAEGISSDFAELHEQVLDAAKRYLPGLRGRTGTLAKEAMEQAQKASVEELAPEAAAGETEQTAEPEFCEVLIRRPGARNLRFNGKLLAGVRTGAVFGRGWDLRVYQTSGGKIVAVKTGLTSFLGEYDRVSAEVFENLDAIQAFFGASDAAKALYHELGLGFDEVIE